MGDCGQKWAWDSNLNEWNLAEFLYANTFQRKLKVTLIVTGWARSNKDDPFISWDSIIWYISRMNEWIELIFCKLIHGIKKAKSYFRYAHGQGCDLLGPGTLKSALLPHLKNKSMNLANFYILEVME